MRPVLAVVLLAACKPAPTPVDPDAADLGFRLFYKERANRTVLAYNRFALFGDTVAATTIDRAGIARSGNTYEVLPVPKDNNLMGTSTWATYHAARNLQTRELELTLIRQLEGLAWAEAVTGHPGLTVREVLPGWTRHIGADGQVTRTHAGAAVSHPSPPDAALEAEILATFYDGLDVTYREDPGEFIFNAMPAVRPGRYAISSSLLEPEYIRWTDCCSSLMHTPDGHEWAGAWWGNHNSRDNFPDLALGLLAAQAAADDDALSEDVREAARRALAAGHRIGDRIVADGNNLMTVGEFGTYDELIVSGSIRPHGESENQDLGSLGACSMAYLARALSSDGLSADLPEVPSPGALENLLLGDGASGLPIDCDIPTGDVTCTSLGQAACGHEWSNLDQLQIGDSTIFEFAEHIDEVSPGAARGMFGSFQDDFDDIVEATVAIHLYAGLTGDEDLMAEAASVTGAQTDLMRRFADLLWTEDDADRIEQRYEAALFDAFVGRPVVVEDLGGLALEDARLTYIESMLSVTEAAPAELWTDEQLQAFVEDELDAAATPVVRRYTDAYGDTYPIRRTTDGYEATTHPDGGWFPVDVPHHVWIGTSRLFQAMPLCSLRPDLVDCTWARLGCEVPDLDGSGTVDEADRSIFEQRKSAAEGRCKESNAWCDGADLDRSGGVDDLDVRFMQAAQGCTTAM